MKYRMKNRWIAFVAGRYVSRGRKTSASPVFAVLGIAVGVLALIVITSVMNGFQLGFIESILEVSSGHIRVNNFPSGDEGEALVKKIRALPEVVSVLPFMETSALVRGRYTGIRGSVIRGVPPDAFSLDPGLAARLDIEEGYFDIEEKNSIVLGAELARHLGVKTGDSVSLLTVSGGMAAAAGAAENFRYTVTGVFRCGFYEYDLGWAYINIERAEDILPDGQKPALEIKLKNRWRDLEAAHAIAALPGGAVPPQNIVSWRDYNRAFFGALRTEKLAMFILVGLIFIVVGLNIFQAQRRTVLERREEIGLLKALGATDRAVRFIFVWDGLVVGGAGAGIGMAIGLLVASNISAFFTFLEGAVNLFLKGANAALGFFGEGAGAGGTGEFSVFSPQVFYIKEIPSRPIPHEVLLIFLFGFLSAAAAAWFASMKVSITKPAEVLRYE